MTFEERIQEWMTTLNGKEVNYAAAARRLIKQSEADDAHAFTDWLVARQEAILCNYLVQLHGHRRRRTAKRAASSGFATAAKDGSVEGFLATRYHVGGGVSKELGEMVAADFAEPRRQHQMQSRRELMEDAFLGAIERKLNGKKVRDVWSEEKLATLRASLAGRTGLADAA